MAAIIGNQVLSERMMLCLGSPWVVYFAVCCCAKHRAQKQLGEGYVSVTVVAHHREGSQGRN